MYLCVNEKEEGEEKKEKARRKGKYN